MCECNFVTSFGNFVRSRFIKGESARTQLRTQAGSDATNVFDLVYDTYVVQSVRPVLLCVPHTMLAGPLEAWLDFGLEHGSGKDWPT